MSLSNYMYVFTGKGGLGNKLGYRLCRGGCAGEVRRLHESTLWAWPEKEGYY